VIKDNVKMGGGVKVFDSNFHSLKVAERMCPEADMVNKKRFM